MDLRTNRNGSLITTPQFGPYGMDPQVTDNFIPAPSFSDLDVLQSIGLQFKPNDLLHSLNVFDNPKTIQYEPYFDETNNIHVTRVNLMYDGYMIRYTNVPAHNGKEMTWNFECLSPDPNPKIESWKLNSVNKVPAHLWRSADGIGCEFFTNGILDRLVEEEIRDEVGRFVRNVKKVAPSLILVKFGHSISYNDGGKTEILNIDASTTDTVQKVKFIFDRIIEQLNEDPINSDRLKAYVFIGGRLYNEPNLVRSLNRDIADAKFVPGDLVKTVIDRLSRGQPVGSSGRF